MKKYYKYELNITLMNILSIVMFIIPFAIILIAGVKINFDISLGVSIVSIMLYLFMHEILHAIGYFLFTKDKRNIKIGIVLEKGVLYAMCQERINKFGILISLLLPLIFLSFIALPIGLIYNMSWLGLLSIINFAGAVGDIFMTILILFAPSDVEYIDYNNDIGAYLLSESDMSNYHSLGFFLTEEGLATEKEVDKTIKHLYISKTSSIIIVILAIICIIDIILGII